MLEYLGISIIILTVVGSVHFVHRYAYNEGIKTGLEKGRLQILNENLIREKYKSSSNDSTLIELQAYLEKETPRVDRVSKKA